MTALHVLGRIGVRKDLEHATVVKGRRTVESAHVAKAARAMIGPEMIGHVVRGKEGDRVTALHAPVRAPSVRRIAKSGRVVKVGHAIRSGALTGPAGRAKVVDQIG